MNHLQETGLQLPDNLMKILFIQTGGTIDKDYPKTSKGYAFEITTPAVERILKRARPGFEYEVLPLLQKDSLDISQDDRQLLKNTCIESPYDKIVITHGTDTIYETAVFLCGIPGKTIVLTGAFLPERFKDSDADFNLGMAVSAVNNSPEGIYVALSGLVKAINREDSIK